MMLCYLFCLPIYKGKEQLLIFFLGHWPVKYIYVILIMLVMGANVGSILFGICISGWIELARIVRGEVQRLKLREFSMAARLAGAGTGRILWRHLLPNAAGPIIVNLTFMIPKAIFTEAFLSFVGVGISAPDASLGTLIQDARSQDS